MPSGDVFNLDIQKGPQEWVQIPFVAPALWENPFKTKAALSHFGVFDSASA